MSIEAAFCYEVLHTDTIATVIGARLYPVGGVPTSAGKQPFATYQKIGNEHHRHQGGRSGLARPRIQVDCFAELPKAASELAELFRLAFDGFRGEMGQVGSTVTVKGMTLEDDRSFFERPSDGSEKGTWRVSMDFLIWHAET